MNRRLLQLIALVLVMLLGATALSEEALSIEEEAVELTSEMGEGAEIEGEALTVEGIDAVSVYSDAPPVEEIDAELSNVDADLEGETLEEGELTPALDGGDSETDPSSGASEEPGTDPTEEPPVEPGTDPTEEPPVEPEPDPIHDPIPAKTLRLTANATKTVYAKIPYRIVVTDKDIEGCKSSAKSVAAVTAEGLLTLKKSGTAKITVTTKDKKKLTLTLNVNAAPAPSDTKATVSTKGVYRLSWKAAKYATGYTVEVSRNNREWSEVRTLGAGTLTTNITAYAVGTRWFRVRAILGANTGRASKSVSVMPRVTGVKVICEEAYLYGPTNRMNVKWKAAKGAVEYIVYRATVPSTSYKKIGTTKNTWFADRRQQKSLYSYKVQAVYRNAKLGDTAGYKSAAADLWTGLQANVLPPANLTSSTGIILVVNKKAQIVTAYVRDANGKYTVPLRHMICTTGRVWDWTENGTYKLQARRSEWKRYPSGVYIRYPSTYRSGYYFHSPLYSSGKSVMSYTVGQLGSRRSLGCVRLKVRDAEWVYRYLGEGTAVYICDGSDRDSLKSAIRPKKVEVQGF